MDQRRDMFMINELSRIKDDLPGMPLPLKFRMTKEENHERTQEIMKGIKYSKKITSATMFTEQESLWLKMTNDILNPSPRFRDVIRKLEEQKLDIQTRKMIQNNENLKRRMSKFIVTTALPTFKSIPFKSSPTKSSSPPKKKIEEEETSSFGEDSISSNEDMDVVSKQGDTQNSKADNQSSKQSIKQEPNRTKLASLNSPRVGN